MSLRWNLRHLKSTMGMSLSHFRPMESISFLAHPILPLCIYGISRLAKQNCSHLKEFEFECIYFSPNGKYIAAGSYDGTIQLWNIQTGEAASKQFEVDKDAKINCIAFSADGKYVVACSSGEFGLWKDETGEATLELLFRGCLASAEIIAVAISPDMKFIAFNSCRTVLWAIQMDRLDSLADSKRLGGHQGCVASVSFSPDGKYFASCAVQFESTTIQQIRHNNTISERHKLLSSITIQPGPL